MYDIFWKCPNLNIDISIPYRIYLPRNGQLRPVHSDSLWPWLKNKFLSFIISSKPAVLKWRSAD